jgi:ribosomal protein S18 acetylase RimI-like enzyme
MPIDIVAIRKDLIPGHRAAVEAVAAERRYLGRIALPPFDPETAWALQHIANDWPNYCAVQEGEVVGWADVTPNAIPECAHRGTLGMGVVATHRGAGLGAKLLAACIAHTGRAKIEKIELTVYTNNPRAVALYRKFGFVETGLIRDYRRVDGDTYDALLMERLV